VFQLTGCQVIFWWRVVAATERISRDVICEVTQVSDDDNKDDADSDADDELAMD